MGRGRIFINYRRDDSRADSGRLYDRLVSRFPGKVFRDVASLEPGVEWHEAIGRVIGQTDACTVVIGKDWLNITDAYGRRRLDDPGDTVRREVVVALQRKIRVFPVLVGGARMPQERDLPPDLQPLCRRNALEITEQDWDEDFNKLLRALETSLGMSAKRLEGGQRFRGVQWMLAGIGGAAVLIALIAVWNNRPQPARDSGTELAAQTPARTQAPSAPRVDQEPTAEPVDVPAPPRRPALTDVGLIGNWTAVVTGNGQRLDEMVEFYGDHSFRVMLGNEVAGVGAWQYSPAGELLEVTQATNFLENGVKFACAWRMGAGDSFSGLCRDQIQNSWSVSLNRAGGSLPEPPTFLPRVDISRLTTAEKAAFVQALATARCSCTCGLSILVCLRKDLTCNYSPALARNALIAFLRMTRG
jgi:hypothetical protein